MLRALKCWNALKLYPLQHRDEINPSVNVAKAEKSDKDSIRGNPKYSTIGNQQGSSKQENLQRPVQRDVAKAKWGSLSGNAGGEDMV